MQVRTVAVAAVVVLSLAVVAVVAPETAAGIIALCSLVAFGWGAVGLFKPSWARLPNRLAALAVWALWIGLAVVGAELMTQPTDVASAPAQPRPVRPMTDRAESARPVFAVETTGDLRRGRVCPDAGRYYVRAASRAADSNATAILSLDDGSDEGAFVALAMAGPASPASGPSETVNVESGECYWLSVQTGVTGNSASAELWPAR